jgi:hypothetical protein
MKLDTHHADPTLELESMNESFSKTNLNGQSTVSLVAMSSEVTSRRIDRISKD